MRFSGRDEVVLRRAYDASDNDLRRFFGELLNAIVQQGHGKDFALDFAGSARIPGQARFPIDETSVPSAATKVAEILSQVHEEQPVFEPRTPCERTHDLMETPRFAGIADGTKPCYFGEHPMERGEKLYVAQAVIHSSGRQTDLFGCEECAQKMK